MDDRSKEERGVSPLNNDKFRIPKSRYDSITQYLSPGPSYSGGCGPESPVNNDALSNSDGMKSASIEGGGGMSDSAYSTHSVHGDFFKPAYDDLNSVYDTKIFNDLRDAGKF